MPIFMNNSDDRIASRVLRGAEIKREQFNPTKKLHRASLKKFLETGNWGEVQFYAEAPYVTVPETVFRKMAMAVLK